MKPFSAFVIASMLSAFPFSVEAGQSNFSWRSTIGKGTATLKNELQGTATCSDVQHLEYEINAAPFRVSLDNFGGWLSPTRGETGFVMGDRFTSEVIQTLMCKFGATATLVSLSYGGNVFSLELRYHKCDTHGSDCDLLPTNFDKRSYDALVESLVVVPALGTGEIQRSEFEKYVDLKKQFDDSSLARNFFVDAENCFFPGLNQTKYRCLVVLQKFGNTAQSLSFAEIDRSSFLTTLKESLLVGQSFTDLHLQREAAIAFVDEVNHEIDKIHALDNTVKSNQFRRKSILESLE